MATGFQSNFNDSGYLVPSGTYYDACGNQITASSISTSDIYKNTQQVGVYMIDGTRGQQGGGIYAILSSLNDINNLPVPNDADDAWLVYPGYGFILYYDYNYSGTTSNEYINNTTKPVLFTNHQGGYNTIGTLIGTTQGGNYEYNQTSSVKIFFRFQEITIPGLS